MFVFVCLFAFPLLTKAEDPVDASAWKYCNDIDTGIHGFCTNLARCNGMSVVVGLTTGSKTCATGSVCCANDVNNCDKYVKSSPDFSSLPLARRVGACRPLSTGCAAGTRALTGPPACPESMPICCVPADDCFAIEGQSCFTGSCWEGLAADYPYAGKGSCPASMKEKTCCAKEGKCGGECKPQGLCGAGTKEMPVGSGECPGAQVCCQPVKAPPKVFSPGSSYDISGDNPLKGVDAFGVIARIIKAFLGVVGGIALLVFVYAGVKYVISAGNETMVQEAKEAMINAFIGLILIVFAYVIANFVLGIVLR